MNIKYYINFYNYIWINIFKLNVYKLGGKSGAAFSKTSDDRFVIKCISKVELQMFLEFAPAYFGNNILKLEVYVRIYVCFIVY